MRAIARLPRELSLPYAPTSTTMPAPFDLLQPGVFRAGLLEDGDVGVGVLPERQKILVGDLGLGGIAGRHERPAELQVGQRADRIADYDPAVIENPLEFRGCFVGSMCRQV